MITNQTNKVYGAGNGVTNEFPFSFKIFDQSQMTVYLINDTTKVVTGPLTATLDYTVDINPVTEGGTVIFTTAPAFGVTWFLKRVVPLTQEANLPTEGTLPATQIENQLDLAVMMCIQLNESLSHAILTPPTSLITGITLPIPVDGMILAWDGTLGALKNVSNTNVSIAQAVAAAATASAAANSAATTAAAAAASAVTAAASAASVNLPTMVGQALKILRANAGETQLEYKTFQELLTAAAGLSAGGIFKFKKGANVASAATTTLGDDGNVFNITGVTSITSITTKAAGTVIVLYFSSALILINGNNLILQGNFVTAVNYAIMLMNIDGTNWLEISRSTGAVLGSARNQLFLSTNTFIAPAGIIKVFLTMVAGGGGAGSGKGDSGGSNFGGGGGGGAGASIIKFPYTVVAGNSYTVTVGAGGVSVAGVAGTDGGATSFDLKSVAGGKGGLYTTSGGNGGEGGGNIVAALDYCFDAAAAITTTAQAAGAMLFRGGRGAKGTTIVGGGGGSTPFGAGTPGADNGNAGTNATANTGAGGGGGGKDAANVDHAGGNGGSGFCLVEW